MTTRSGTTHRTPTLHRITIVTNGNYFARKGLLPLLELHDTDVDLQIIVTTGLRNQRGNRLLEALRLFRRWGVRYSFYKIGTYAFPLLGQFVRREPYTVEGECHRRGIPVLRIRNVNSVSARALIHSHAPQLLVSFSCPYRIKPDLLALPSIGSLNVHSSLLPSYAGVCTYVHALANNESQTGVTVHEMVEQFDAGAIVARLPIPIPTHTSVFSLFSQQCRVAGQLLVTSVRQVLDAGVISGTKQDSAERTYFAEPTREDIARLHRNGFALMHSTDLSTLYSRSDEIYASNTRSALVRVRSVLLRSEDY